MNPHFGSCIIILQITLNRYCIIIFMQSTHFSSSAYCSRIRMHPKHFSAMSGYCIIICITIIMQPTHFSATIAWTDNYDSAIAYNIEGGSSSGYCIQIITQLPQPGCLRQICNRIWHSNTLFNVVYSVALKLLE